MVELLLKIRVAIESMFTPILWLALSPLNNDMSYLFKAFPNFLIQCVGTCVVLTSLGINIGNPGEGHP